MNQPPELLKLLANDLRWNLLKILTVGDFRVHELVERLDQPMNLVSYHLKHMRADALLTTRRSDADGRDVYYSLDLDRLRELYLKAGIALHPALGNPAPLPIPDSLPALRVLFVCTHNSARSQMAEGFLRALSHEQVQVYSAGSHPTQVHPDAIRTMDSFGIDIRRQQARHVDEFAGQTFHYVITVCDNAREVCPTFPGGPPIHWSFADPVIILDDDKRSAIFQQIAQRLQTRIGYFLAALQLDKDN